MVLKLFSNHNLTISFPPFLCRTHSCVSEESREKQGETRTHAHTQTHAHAHTQRQREREGGGGGGRRGERERERPSEQASVHVNRCSYGIVHL